MHFAFIRNALLLVLLAGSASLSAQIPPRMRIYHFDVHVGNATHQSHYRSVLRRTGCIHASVVNDLADGPSLAILLGTGRQ